MCQVRAIPLRLYTILLCLLFAAIAVAQSDYGSIGGFVKDPSGGVVPKAKVVIKNEATNQENAVTTNDSGYYTVPNLPPGLYTITAEASGLQEIRKHARQAGRQLGFSLDAALGVGATTEIVEVTRHRGGSANRVRFGAE